MAHIYRTGERGDGDGWMDTGDWLSSLGTPLHPVQLCVILQGSAAASCKKKKNAVNPVEERAKALDPFWGCFHEAGGMALKKE